MAAMLRSFRFCGACLPLFSFLVAASRKKGNQAGADSYEASDIVALEGLEAVRKRPGMYIGSTGPDGLMHLVWELIDNGVDEASAGHASKILVTIHEDGSVEVVDNGRGIPVDTHPTKKVSALEVVLTELHAGGKFGGGAYNASGGLHGVGASVVNAMSSKLCAEVERDGAKWRLWFSERRAGQFKGQKFAEGHKLHKVKASKKTGTSIRFWPDLELFDADAQIDFKEIGERAKQACYLVPGLMIKVEDKRPGGGSMEFSAKGGLSDLVDTLSDKPKITNIVPIKGEGEYVEKVSSGGKMVEVTRKCEVDIALRWVKGYESKVLAFVNTIPTPQGGTHMTGFERALNKAVNDRLLADSKKLAKLAKQGQDRAQREDVQEGLVAAVKVTIPEPQFRGQTKQELGTPPVQSIVYNIVKDGFEHWVKTGPKSHVNALASKIADAVVGRVSARQTLENKRKAASLGSARMPDKLADCRVHGLDSELLLVEGDSAAGPAKAGRDSETMAILPLRGKVVNAGKATVKQVLDNAEAQALFTAVGAGSGDSFDLDKARYGRIVILCDADVDGSHIRCLLLTLIYRFMRPMLEAGRVYAALPPLYTAKVGSKTHRAWTDQERDRLTAKITRGKKTAHVQWSRFKGLGEMGVDELAECALNPDTRTLKRMSLSDAEQAASVFDTLMGSDVSIRKDYIIQHSSLIDADRLDC